MLPGKSPNKMGWQAVSIRKVAEKIEYSGAALYEYFESKDAILRALMREGFALLAQNMTDAAAQSGADNPRLFAVGQAYWEFAFANPDLYQVMHGLGGIPFGTAETPPEAVRAFEVLREAVRAAMPSGEHLYNDLDAEVDAFWAMLHGIVSLTMAHRIKGGAARAKLVAKRATEIYLAAWQEEGRTN